MDWWQTLILTAVPVAFTATGLVLQSLIGARATRDAGTSAASQALATRRHELELSEREYRRSVEREDADRLRTETAAALDGILKFYSALQLDRERSEVVEAEHEARRSVAAVLANRDAVGKAELTTLLTHLTISARVRDQHPESWSTSSKAANDVTDKILEKYLETQNAKPAEVALRE